MKNKGVTVILVLVVGGIWYNVFFRLKNSIEPVNLDNTFHTETTKIELNQERMNYEVNANYRDPFGNVEEVQPELVEPLSNKEQIAPSPPPKKEKPPVPPVRWPSIRYHGSVKSQKQTKSRAILKIDGQLYTLQEGDAVLDGMVVHKIYLDSIRLECNKQKKIFYRHTN